MSLDSIRLARVTGGEGGGQAPNNYQDNHIQHNNASCSPLSSISNHQDQYSYRPEAIPLAPIGALDYHNSSSVANPPSTPPLNPHAYPPPPLTPPPKAPTGVPSTLQSLTSNNEKGSADSNIAPQSGLAEQETQNGLTKKEIWKYRGKLIAGLFIPYFLNAVDTTIVSTALPHIASDFGQLSQQSWIVTSFTLTATAFIPSMGQFCDIFGRHAMLQFSLLLMLIGSTLCAGAQTFGMLLFGRAIAGISSSGLLVVTSVVLGDKVSLKENALQRTLFGFVAGVSFGVGPVIGGGLTSLHWRWCFGFSIPLSILAHILAYFFLRPIMVKAEAEESFTRSASGTTVIHRSTRSFTQKLAVVDWEGLSVFLIGCTCLIMALTWGGSTYSWGSPRVIVLLVVGILLIVSFIAIEKGMEQNGWLKELFGGQHDIWGSRRAMIPLELFSSKDLCILTLVNFTQGVCKSNEPYHVLRTAVDFVWG